MIDRYCCGGALKSRTYPPRIVGIPNGYKIKLRTAGYRLACQVIDDKLVIFVIGAGRGDEGYEELLRAGLKSLSDLD